MTRTKIAVPWGTGTVPVFVADERLGPVLSAPRAGVADERTVVEDAVRVPPGDLASFVHANRDIVVVVNDATRPTPTARALGYLSPFLGDARLSFIVASGTHRAPSEAELADIFGADIVERYRERIICHDSRDPERLEMVGTTQRGTPIWVNSAVARAKSLLLINSVEPHYFAGYTGGQKSLVPGVAGFATVEANHRLALDPGAVNLALRGNPLREDLDEAAALILRDKRAYSLQLVLAPDHQVVFAAGGSLDSTFAQAVAAADRQYVLDMDRPYDVVVAVAPHPLDCDLYQANKAIQSGARALRPGGILILVTECPFGLGDNQTFFRVLSAASTPAEVLAAADETYVLGLHQATTIARVLQDGQIWAVTSLPSEQMRAIFFRPFESVQAAVDAALDQKGAEARVAFLLEASMTVPRVQR